ncbi:MAG: biopolymer transporter ExbD [Prevotella sp.]|nr:biopolymer transporter ExbD [Prevotella sp.]
MNRRFARHGDNRNSVPMLNTAALPDLIFTVLFFFMIVTHMRDVELQVRYQVPQGTEVQKLGHRGSVVDIYVGRPYNAAADSEDFVIQLGNNVATIADIASFIERERQQMSSDDQTRLTVSIKADKDVPMGIISDIKQALQKSYALRISYSAGEKMRE